ncbi:unnamed protein product [Candida verbasci]|uniref:DNA mismatch repair protein n=1 Tax=Candida verbasci TaxID=1227364 RepID=A0A9W4TWQ4_9ASCO|nr:unnamed protein product [Candida verbasci]
MAKLATQSKQTSQNGSSSQKKQSSLMSFFEPVSKDKSQPKSSPTPVKNNHSLLDSSPLRSKEFSDKENISTSSMTSPQEPTIRKEFVKPACKKQPLGDKSFALNSSPVQTGRDRGKQQINYTESDSEDEIIGGARKRRRIVNDDDDDDDDDDDSENEPDFKPESEDEDDEMSEIEGTTVASDLEDEIEVKPKKKSSPKQKPTGSAASRFNASSSYQATDYKPIKHKPQTTTKKSFAKENEERYQWLVNIRDAEKRSIDDPDYDPRTLYIPQSAWSKFTAFEKQYWEIKSKMWNTVVFFKKGKFYELYENDAMIAHTQFDLKIAGGGRANMKLAGIPEMSFEYWAKEFISAGYKVAKVDQKESMLMKEIRGGSGTKEEKIIKRELSAILTGGTLTDLEMISDDMSTYCLSIKEEVQEDCTKKFGVVFVDTATSELNFIEIDDDAECTKLDTLITQIKPKEIICEKGNLCPIVIKILKYSTNNQIWNNMNPITEFWDYDITIEQLVKSKYYHAKDLDDFSNYPPVLLQFKENYKIAFNAFGGLLNYLKLLKLDSTIMSLANMKQYKISKNESSHLILDGTTLNNLEILNNSSDNSDKGTLFRLINRASTPFGKRHLKKWVLHPLMKINDINARYDAIDYLMDDGLEIRSVLQDTLTNLPDLERLLARIHSGNLKFRDFLRVVESFESIARFSKQLSEFTDTNCGVLHKYIQSFPIQMKDKIQEWEDSFDREQAKNDIIIPATGVDEEFDNSQAIIKELETELEAQLKEYKKEYKSHEICYRDSGKEIYLIEIPIKLVKHIPRDWQQMAATSKVKRFWSPEVKVLARKLMEQKELHKEVCDNLKTRMYQKFDQNYEIWMKVINSIANIDCILALTKVSETIGYPSCRPKFIESDNGYINFKQLRHPCFISTKDFIPNDIKLGGDKEPNFGLLTGANAAGKSTLMRTTGLAIILSQIGCHIPAESAELTPVDRIMTRLGANDNIMQGKSTFFVELSETKKILSNATPKSLVILDELGRGGSSSDGFAIAESVLYHISTHIQSIGFFATHYGTLGQSFKLHPQIKPIRMGIVVDNDSRNITFLYKLEEGTAPGSFGMNVASMCGISNEIVANAEIAAKNHEQTSKLKKLDEEDHIDISLGLQSDFNWFANDKIKLLAKDIVNYEENVQQCALENIFKMIDKL